VIFCRPAGDMMGYQPTHNGQYDGYHDMNYEQQGMGYASHMQTCTSAGNNMMTSLKLVYMCACSLIDNIMTSLKLVYMCACSLIDIVIFTAGAARVVLFSVVSVCLS